MHSQANGEMGFILVLSLIRVSERSGIDWNSPILMDAVHHTEYNFRHSIKYLPRIVCI